MIWVDTDFGFDDLWALLLLRQHGVAFAGVSLVAGNVPLAQSTANALGAIEAYDLALPLSVGASKPLVRDAETAEAVLGPTGMQTRGLKLPEVETGGPLPDAVTALSHWLLSAKEGQEREILAIGPLTNIAHLLDREPEAARKITRLVWMGGSNGPGNHTPFAEYNAFADPEAANRVMTAGLPMEVVDLTICRSVTFSADDIPVCDPLTADLLGGYLDIAVARGRQKMAIYDPVAALVMVSPELFVHHPVTMSCDTTSGENYGATNFEPVAAGHGSLSANSISYLVANAPETAARTCLKALVKKER